MLDGYKAHANVLAQVGRADLFKQKSQKTEAFAAIQKEISVFLNEMSKNVTACGAIHNVPSCPLAVGIALAWALSAALAKQHYCQSWMLRHTHTDNRQ